MVKWCILMTLTFVVAGAAGALSGEKLLAGLYPDMTHFKLPPPPEHRPLTPSDLAVDVERIEKLESFRAVPAERGRYVRIARFYRDDPDGKRAWVAQNAAHVLQAVNAWELPKDHHPAYQVRWVKLDKIVDSYFYTGHPLLGRFIHDYTMHAMTLDTWFWMGQTLRWARGDARHADLQALPFALVINPLLSRCRELFTDEETALVEAKYREYVLESCYEDLRRREKSRSSADNWTAVLAGALLLSSKYFDDAPKADYALKTIDEYFRNKIEDDGSYGEGFGYANYAVGVVPTIYPYLSERESDALFDGSPFRYFPTWLLYHDFRHPDKFYRTAFADDNYFGLPSLGMMYVLALRYGDSNAAYLGSRHHGRKPWWNAGTNTLLIGDGKAPTPREPGDLPLMAEFANGELFIRAGWRTEDAVFACYRVHPGKVNAHKRPESGNFVFGYNGVPLIMHSGNTNLYRRPIHQKSIRTSAANTLTLDGEDQAPPERQRVRYLEIRDDADMTLVRCDMRTAYSRPLRKMVRTFAWLKRTRHLAVIDDVEAEDGEYEYAARLHLNDIFRDTELRREEDGSFFYRHPRATLTITASGACRTEKGYVVSERFSNWDETNQQKEADRGNVHVIVYGPGGKQSRAVLYAVIGENKVAVKHSENQLVVDDLIVDY